MSNHYDLIIIGTGAGGGTLAYALADTGQQILLLERGDFIPRESKNWDVQAIHSDNHYQTEQRWFDTASQKAFRPTLYHRVGGSTKVYGAALFRMRINDFNSTNYQDGLSPAWPIGYDEFEPYYTKAENLFKVHGNRGEDPTEPPTTQDLPFKAISHEPKVQMIADRLSTLGLHPFALPMGIDQGETGSCIRCNTCDGYPCKIDAKADAQTCCITPALKYSNVTLKTQADVQRLVTDDSGNIVKEVQVIEQGQQKTYSAERVVVACGAINSAALLLKSANQKHPRGLGNSSGMVGRHLMKHNVSKVYAVDWTPNHSVFQKTLGFNDYYQVGNHRDRPVGHVHLMGKHTVEMMRSDFPRWIPTAIVKQIAKHSIDWWVQSEDFPDINNKVTVDTQGQISVTYHPNHLQNHRQLVKTFKRLLHQAGIPVVFSAPVGLKVMNHQMGTCRFGSNPQESVLDLNCRCHDVPNLYVVDSSFFPSSSAINPTLTIVANALRVADSMRQDWSNHHQSNTLQPAIAEESTK